MKNSGRWLRSVQGMNKPLPRRARGFTLIEMIAAFVIFAIAVGALMQILTMSMNNARYSADETRAALWAQSLLDNVGVGERVGALLQVAQRVRPLGHRRVEHEHGDEPPEDEHDAQRGERAVAADLRRRDHLELARGGGRGPAGAGAR